MNKATPPEAKGVETNSQLYPEIQKFQVCQNEIQILLEYAFKGFLDFHLG